MIISLLGCNPFSSHVVGRWLEEHHFTAGMFMILGFGNPEVLSVLNCKLYDWSVFSIGWSREAYLRIRSLGLLVNIFADIPQLVISILYFIQQGDEGSALAIAILSLVLSSLSILHGIVRRLLLTVVLFCRRKEPADFEMTSEN